MKLGNIVFTSLLALTAFALVVAQDRAKKDPTKSVQLAKPDSAKTEAKYVCPMHPDVRSDKPGTCPKCGMDLVAAKAPRGVRGQGGPREKLDKAKLVEDGRYNCCIRPSCEACANMGHDCNCYDDVKEGHRICRECYAGWQDGKGSVPGFTKDSVKTFEFRMRN